MRGTGAVLALVALLGCTTTAAAGCRQALALGLDVSGSVDLIANPIRLSETPVAYAGPPPMLGEHTAAVLTELLGSAPDDIAALRDAGVIRRACDLVIEATEPVHDGGVFLKTSTGTMSLPDWQDL